MGHVKINTGSCDENPDVPVSDSAMRLVRGQFNPSGLVEVNRLKSLAAAFISECEKIVDSDGFSALEASIAITQMQGACMFAVAAATDDL